MKLVQKTCTRNLHRCTWPKLCSLIGRLCLKVTGTWNLHQIELRCIRCKFLAQVSWVCVTSISMAGFGTVVNQSLVTLHWWCCCDCDYKDYRLKDMSDWSLFHQNAVSLYSMAEAHSAVAFSFHVTTEGVNVQFNHEALWAVWRSGVRSWKKRIGRIKVCRKCGAYHSSRI